MQIKIGLFCPPRWALLEKKNKSPRNSAGQAAKASGSHAEWTTISLRLGACPPRRTGFCEKKKRKNKARKAAKTPRQSAAAESYTERTTIPLRLGVFARINKLQQGFNPKRSLRAN